ncbi:DUF262 domain-containing protein [Microbispora sp. NEAU-D428]|uniref:DUF262 domain-containing protein n=1 Tax=Microbispora sitophila TaxID=2771537 RepID=UPI0018676799|nr:DUF262 domain-containing protein [Microbispora sitophila]MBE3008480.1 DUF262 domain-containing protein [Microbispora sitophila]
MATVTRPRVEQARPTELVEWARQGLLRIPSFQRSFRWGRDDVVKLFDSILRGYPIGTLLMWRRPAAAARLEIGPLLIDAPDVAAAYWVVDGQQRVTSLIGALTAPPDVVDPRFRIFYDLEADRFVSAGRREPVREHWFPVQAACDREIFWAWQRDRPWLTDVEMDRCDSMMEAIRDYMLPLYVVTGDDEQAVREMFDRLNTSGHRLTQAEIFDALNTVSDQMEPSNLTALAATVKGFGFGQIPDRVLVQSVLAIRHGRVDRDFRGEFRDDADRLKAFKKTEHALGIVVDFLREEAAIPHIRVLPYLLFLPVLTRFVALFGPPEGRAGELLRRWVWRGSAVGVAPQGNIAALRRNGLAVEGDPVQSADRLLRLLSRESWQPDLRAFRPNQPQARLNLLALLASRPRVLAAPPGSENRVGLPIDPVWLLDQGWNPLVTVTRTEGWRQETIASRIVHPRDVPDRAIREAIGQADAETLRSHLIDDISRRELLQDREGFFLVSRSADLEKAIEEHVQENALFGFPDGPALIRPE